MPQGLRAAAQQTVVSRYLESSALVVASSVWEDTETLGLELNFYGNLMWDLMAPLKGFEVP